MSDYSQHTVLDLFAGSGVGVAIQQLGAKEYGVELMPEAVATREANGMETIYNDVWDIEKAEGYIFSTIWASPSCQTFSMAGKGAGRKALDDVLATLKSGVWRDIPRLKEWANSLGDERIGIVLTPLSYVDRYRPRFVVLEQVPPVLPVWEAMAEEMRQMGYSAWTGYLNSEQYGEDVKCPIHDPALAAAESLSPQRLATAGPAGRSIEQLVENPASIVVAREEYVQARLGVQSARNATPGTTDGEAKLRAAWTATYLSRLVVNGAQDATWRSLVTPLLLRALAETRTLNGRAGGLSMSEATSAFASTEFTEGSIESLPNRLWGALCSLAKSYITSTGAPTITTPVTLRSSRTTASIATTTQQEIGQGSCGACDDWATPQTRKRAYLIARDDGREATPPAPTHSKYYSRDPKRLDPGVKPWVSMAEALGWGMTERAYPTVSTGASTAGGGTDPAALGGSGARKFVYAQRDAGAWTKKEAA